MKMIFKTVVLLLLVNVSFGQTINISEPEFVKNAVYVNDTIGTGIPLEKQKFTIKSSSNGAAFIPVVGLALGKATTKIVFQGNESTVKISKTGKIRFIITVIRLNFKFI